MQIRRSYVIPDLIGDEVLIISFTVACVGYNRYPYEEFVAFEKVGEKFVHSFVYLKANHGDSTEKNAMPDNSARGVQLEPSTKKEDSSNRKIDRLTHFMGIRLGQKLSPSALNVSSEEYEAWIRSNNEQLNSDDAIYARDHRDRMLNAHQFNPFLRLSDFDIYLANISPATRKIVGFRVMTSKTTYDDAKRIFARTEKLLNQKYASYGVELFSITEEKERTVYGMFFGLDMRKTKEENHKTMQALYLGLKKADDFYFVDICIEDFGLMLENDEAENRNDLDAL